MNLRKVKLSDLDNIIKYENIYFDSSLGYDYLKYQIGNLDSYYILLEDDNNNLIGYIGSTLEEMAEIQNFFVVKNYRGKGYSKLLLQSVIDESIKRNVKSIYLEVNKENLVAISLYLKYGFKVSRIREGYYNGKDAIVMIKEMK